VSASVVGFDCETWLIRPGQLAPPMVCLTLAAWDGVWLHHPRFDGAIPLTQVNAKPFAYNAKDAFLKLLQCEVVAGLNIAYDMAVCAAQWPDLIPAIFKAYEEDRVVDVGLAMQLIDIAHGKLKVMQAKFGYSLVGLERRLLRKDRRNTKEGPDIWRMRYRELDYVPPQEWPRDATVYACEDAVGARDIYNFLWDSPDRQYLQDLPAQSRAAFVLQLMMCWGVMVDADKVGKLEMFAKEKYHELSLELIQDKNDKLVRGFDTIKRNLIWTKDVAAAKRRMVEVCKEHGLPLKLTDTGFKKYIKALEESGKQMTGENPPEQVLSAEDMLAYASVDEDACRRTGDEALMAFSLRSQMHTVIYTHVLDLFKGVDTPIQPRYTTLVDTGRTACSKTRTEDGKKKGFSPTNGFQFQNPKRQYDWIPPGKKKAEPLFPPGIGIRECFVARPGTIYADNDFNGLELCTGAQACIDLVGYSKLGEALNAGTDPHLDFGATLMGISYRDALARKHEKEVRYHRQLAKIANFGLPGGLGIRGIVGFARGYGVKLNEEEAKKLKQDWFDKYPEWIAYFRWIRDRLELDMEDVDSDNEHTRVFVRGTFEQLRVGRWRGKCKFTEACNGFFQGLGGDVSKRALWAVSYLCYVKVTGSTLFGARPVGFIHDEILAEVLRELAHEQAYEIAKVMCEAGNTLLPDVPVKCVPALSQRWCKEVEAVFNKEGRLQAYDLARDGRWEVYYDQHAEVRVKWD
jgi:hypothetical protein